MASKLKLTHTTPGFIATHRKARWALSADDEFRPRGAKTAIVYQDDFDAYLKLLLRGLDQNDKKVKNIFAEWDRALFPATAAKGFGARPAGQADIDEEMDEALAALEDNPEDEDDGDEQAGENQDAAKETGETPERHGDNASNREGGGDEEDEDEGQEQHGQGGNDSA